MDVHDDPQLAPLEKTPEGVKIGECILTRRVGAGATGTVYYGKHLALDIEVAVKILSFHTAAADSTAVARFQKEARATVRIDHPNIVRMFHIGEERGVHYLTMEFIGGESAADLLKRRGPLPERKALEIAIVAGEALVAAHAKGILHRDVKPANIMIRAEDGRVKLADLGLAKALGGKLGSTSELTATGQVLGTPAYMSPEQGEDASRADETTDIYSLGATLYALCSGKAPFEATQLLKLLKKVANEEPKELRSLRPDVTEKTAEAVKRLMSKNPGTRPQTMKGAVALLRGCLEAALGVGGHVRTLDDVTPSDVCASTPFPVQGGGAPPAFLQERGMTQSESPVRTLDDVTPSQVHREGERVSNAISRARSLIALREWEEAALALEDALAHRPGHKEAKGLLQDVHMIGRDLLALAGHSDCVYSAAFSPDGMRIVTGSGDGTAKVWDASTGREFVTLEGHSGTVFSVSFSPDGMRIVTGSGDGTARVWDAETGRGLVMLRGHQRWVRSAAFSPDGKRIVTGSGDGTAKVWDAGTGQERLTLSGHSKSVLSAAFSRGGKRILTASFDRTARVWDEGTGRGIVVLKGHLHRVCSAAFSPDGKRIVTGSGDGTARTWDAGMGTKHLTLEGHSAAIWSAVFSPDGGRIATGSRDNSAKVWDAETGREILALRGHSLAVYSAAFSPGGMRIATAGGDKTVRVWYVGE